MPISGNLLCQFPAKNFLAFTLQNHNLVFSLLLYMSEKSCNFLLITNFYLLAVSYTHLTLPTKRIV